MNKFSIIILLLLLSLSLKITKAQIGTVQMGAQPSSVNWYSIENEAVKVIFPDSTLKEAQRIADIIKYINQNATVSVGYKSKKLDLLLNTNTTQANGYVTVAPYHSQFYATGFQNFNRLGSLSWLDQLAIHEYRHSLQLTNTKLLPPTWFLEGDAVLAETILSPAGRGRLPSFFEEQKAHILSGTNFSYTQARGGSFKNLLPNDYPLGYALVNYARNHFGADVWPKVLADAGSKNRYRPFAFSRSLARYTGLSTPKLYELAYQELKEQWVKELDSVKLTFTKPITSDLKVVSNYVYPHSLADGSIICLKNAYNEPTKLTIIKNGVEQSITSIGVATEPFLSVTNNKVAWTEMRKDPRRNAVEYSVIMSYDLTSGLKKQLTRKSKYFSPSFSASGDKLVVVDANQYIQNCIKVLDPLNCSVIQTIPNEQNDFLSYPKWSNQDSGIIYLAKRDSKVCILKYDLASKKTTELTDWTSHAIGTYTINKDLVYFTASFSGINNIYAVKNNGDKHIVQVTSVSIGAAMPAITQDSSLVVVEPTVMGKQLTRLPLDTNMINKLPIKIIEPISMPQYNVLTNNQEFNILENIPQKQQYSVLKYDGVISKVKWGNWAPSLALDFDDRSYGLSMATSDILGSFMIGIMNGYNVNENIDYWGAGFTYAKLFLPIMVKTAWGSRATPYLPLNTVNPAYAEFKQRELAIGVSLPLSWYRGNYTTGFKLNTFLSTISTTDYVIAGNSDNKKLNFNSFKATFDFYNTRRKALQNTNSKWSQTVKATYDRSLSNAVVANRFIFQSSLTAVGLSKNHGLQFGFKLLSEQNNNDYLYEDQFTHARGYKPGPRDLEQVFSVDYSLPLTYPDWGVNGVFFVNRIKANLFYDMGRVYQHNRTLHQNSVGVDLILDTKFFYLAPYSIGLRNVFLLNKEAVEPNKKYHFEVFLTLGL